MECKTKKEEVEKKKERVSNEKVLIYVRYWESILRVYFHGRENGRENGRDISK